MNIYKSVRSILVKFYIFLIRRKKDIKLYFLKSKSIVGRLTFKKKLNQYFKTSNVRLLQLGSGDNDMKGWLNTDLYPKKGFVYLDASKPFNIPESSFDRIFSEHMIEHITYQDAVRQLKECFRILKLGSKIRVATPDLSHYIKLFEDINYQIEYREWVSENWLKKSGINHKNPSFFLNLVMHSWGHEFIYDFDTLKTTLEEIGFSNVKQYDCYESDDKYFQDIERHGDYIGNREMNNIETLIIEADKI